MEEGLRCLWFFQIFWNKFRKIVFGSIKIHLYLLPLLPANIASKRRLSTRNLSWYTSSALFSPSITANFCKSSADVTELLVPLSDAYFHDEIKFNYHLGHSIKYLSSITSFSFKNKEPLVYPHGKIELRCYDTICYQDWKKFKVLTNFFTMWKCNII